MTHCNISPINKRSKTTTKAKNNRASVFLQKHHLPWSSKIAGGDFKHWAAMEICEMSRTDSSSSLPPPPLLSRTSASLPVRVVTAAMSSPFSGTYCLYGAIQIGVVRCVIDPNRKGKSVVPSLNCVLYLLVFFCWHKCWKDATYTFILNHGARPMPPMPLSSPAKPPACLS